MFEYNENSPAIGTEILDNALPSNINFDDISKNSKPGSKEYEGDDFFFGGSHLDAYSGG